MAANKSRNKKPLPPWYVDWWPVLAVAPLSALAVFAYLLNFGTQSSDDQGHWGQFGDYVGGLLNPFVALFALVMLIVAVRLQRTELQATRDELEANREVAEEQRKVMARQLFEAQFFSTLNLLVARLDQARARADHGEFVNVTADGAAIRSTQIWLDNLVSILEREPARYAPLVSLIKVAANALASAEPILQPIEIENYASTLRGFIFDFEVGFLLAAMHRDPPGSPLEIAVEKFRLIEGMRKPLKRNLWRAEDRPRTLINRLPANILRAIEQE